MILFFLIGVAFAVIIPEGVLTLIKAYTLRSHHHIQQRSNIIDAKAVDGKICLLRYFLLRKM